MDSELQLPNRLTRQLPQSRAPWTNHLRGVVLQAPGTPGQSIQNLIPAQQPLHSSLTAINNVRKPKTLKQNH